MGVGRKGAKNLWRHEEHLSENALRQAAAAMLSDNLKPAIQMNAASAMVLTDAGRYELVEYGIRVHQAHGPPGHVVSQASITVDTVNHESAFVARDLVPHTVILYGDHTSQHPEFRENPSNPLEYLARRFI